MESNYKYCDFCGDEITENQEAFHDKIGAFHADCLVDYLMTKAGLTWIARQCGFKPLLTRKDMDV